MRLFFCLLLLVSSHVYSGIAQDPNVDTSMYAFSADITPRIFSQDSNAIFSPYSLYSCLSMTYVGAKGSTKEQIAKVLHISQNNNDSFLQSLQSVNDHTKKSVLVSQALCVAEKYQLNDEYVSSIQKYLGADLFKVNFSNPESALEKVNHWVATNTNGKIDHLLGPRDVSSETRLILLNALYFKGQWRMPFDPKNTTFIDFTNRKGEVLKVPAMHATQDYSFFEDDVMSVLSLDFSEGHENIAMYFVLPKISDNFAQCLSHLTCDKFLEIKKAMQFNHIELFLPKCTIDMHIEVQDILKKMGMLEAFTKKADFSLISRANDLYIDKVIHQARLEVNENGVEATAATAVTMMMKSMRYPEKAKIISFDRPYYVVIEDKKMAAPLFIGQVLDPLKP